MKKLVFTVFTVTLLLGGALYLGISTYASDQTSYEAQTVSLEVDENGLYSLEDMLVYAMLDEIHAKQTYEAMIGIYGDIRPFTKIMEAEQTHIDLLLPLFETYEIELPVSDYVAVIPDTIEETLAIGVEAEIINIALYEAFLAQDLPDDVRVVFEQLVNASNHHLDAFSKYRSSMNGGLGSQKSQYHGYRGQKNQNSGSNDQKTQNCPYL
jgi:hypothetical protein